MAFLIDETITEKNDNGCVEVICGSMFSGKTEELIRRLKRAIIAKQRVEIYKSAVDTRYSECEIVSHNGTSVLSTPITSSESLLILCNNIDVIGIDEAQFLDNSLPAVCKQLADRGIRVIVAGLDMDFKGLPFGPIPNLCAIADHVTKVHAVCMRCGNSALYSHRLREIEKQVMLGEQSEYEPLCRKCYNKSTLKQ